MKVDLPLMKNVFTLWNKFVLIPLVLIIAALAADIGVH